MIRTNGTELWDLVETVGEGDTHFLLELVGVGVGVGSMPGVTGSYLAPMGKGGLHRGQQSRTWRARQSPMTLFEPPDPSRPAQICPWGFQFIEPISCTFSFKSVGLSVH